MRQTRTIGQILWLLAILTGPLAFTFPAIRHVSRHIQKQTRSLRQLVQVPAPLCGDLLSRFSSVQTSEEMTTTSQEKNLPEKTLIIGGGPSGLFSAIALARRGYKNIEVFERLSRPADPNSPVWGDPYRSYNVSASSFQISVLSTITYTYVGMKRCVLVLSGRCELILMIWF